MKQDPKLSFIKLEKESNYQEFPSADNVTRRLKKLIQIIMKYEQSNNGVISFVETKITKEPTGFNLDEKNQILKYLIDKGVPVNFEGRNDFTQFKEEISSCVKFETKHSPQEFERLVQRIEMIAQIVISLESKSNDESLDCNKLDELDPDNDNFIISYEDSDALIKNMNILSFIRKNVLSSNAKLFFNAIPSIKNSDYKNLPDLWDPEVHDKELLYSVINKGFSSLSSIKQNEPFDEINISHEELVLRLSFLCEFFKEYTSTSKQKKKKELMTIQNELLNSQINNNNGILLSQISNAKKSKGRSNILKTYPNGEIVFPVIINSSLSILNFGKIEFERVNYHSEKNFFPIGYVSIREHISMINPPNRCNYTCEILDGGLRPIFQLTCSDDESNPIIKDSCTGCWIVVCNRINNIQKNRKSKVTISGTERFGLCDVNVCKILQNLKGADQCKRYVMKNFD